MKTVVNRSLDFLLFIILAAMALVVAGNVFCRFLLHFSLSWGDELALILMVWLTFLGAAVAVREKAHYAFDYLVRNLPPKPQKTFKQFTHVVSILAISCLLYWSTEVTWGIRIWVMPATEISRAWVYGACPVSCLFMLFYSIENLFHAYK
jgi:TRAP-type C4-dicarboxylate transport system permease small subunit